MTDMMKGQALLLAGGFGLAFGLTLPACSGRTTMPPVE